MRPTIHRNRCCVRPHVTGTRAIFFSTMNRKRFLFSIVVTYYILYLTVMSLGNKKERPEIVRSSASPLSISARFIDSGDGEDE